MVYIICIRSCSICLGPLVVDIGHFFVEVIEVAVIWPYGHILKWLIWCILFINLFIFGKIGCRPCCWLLWFWAPLHFWLFIWRNWHFLVGHSPKILWAFFYLEKLSFYDDFLSILENILSCLPITVFLFSHPHFLFKSYFLSCLSKVFMNDAFMVGTWEV